MKHFLLSTLLVLLPMSAYADDSGSCGENLVWTYVESTQTLTISGSGTMKNYHFSNPWYSYRDNIKTVIIKPGVTSIGDFAFWKCYQMNSVTIPSSMTRIGERAFDACIGLTSVNITDLAAWCKIDFVLQSSNPFTYATTLYLNGSEIKDLVIPNGVTSIAYQAFFGCSGLTSVTIPNSVTTIGSDAFSYCSGLTSVTIPNSVTSIGGGAFESCSGLTSVTIPNSVTSIEDRTFYECSGLTSVTIPNSVTSIGSWAFDGCI